jgi:dsDNA-specific endonuclease/ATPase MutS2
MGIPGESRAVDIAARNGFPEKLVSLARSYLDEERSDVSALIAGLKEKHRELDDAAKAGKMEERRLIEEKTHLIVTTHHGILKNYGYTREGVENASMEFDSRTLSPTFRIVMGIPGESRAVDIAARNGFPASLVSAARSYLDEERSDVSALIAGLKEKHRELDAAAEAGRMEERRLLEERRQADLK